MKKIKNWILIAFWGGLVLHILDAIFHSYPSKILIIVATIAAVMMLIYDIVKYIKGKKEEEKKSIRPIVKDGIWIVCLMVLVIIEFL